MKKFFFLASVLVASMTINAEVITLDLAHPTNPAEFNFFESGMWDQTWNNQDYTYFTSQVFSFSHTLCGAKNGNSYWDGFTVSKATKDGEGAYDFFSNTAKGGLKGEGTPYILAYYNEWWLMDELNEDMTSSNLIKFNAELYPRYVYVNNALVSYNDIVNGDYTGYKFKKGDKFELWIQALDDEYYHELSDPKVVYRLADYTSETESEWFLNDEWAKVDISELGKAHGLAFTLVTTAKGAYGSNTSMYFALDGLTVSTTPDEATAIDNTNAELKAVKILRNGQVVIVRDGKMFNVLGAAL